MILDVHRLLKEVQDADKYDLFITECYTRALESKNEDIRYKAAESLYNLWLRKEQYEEAEKCLEYMSRQNPERKRMQALVFGKTGRVQEAYRAYEELLLADYQMISMIFNSMYMLAVRDEDMEKARYYVEKQAGLARLFEMGEYYEISGRLDLAIVEKDEKTVADTAEKMKQNLLRCFKDEGTFGFMKENVRWKKLMEDL